MNDLDEQVARKLAFRRARDKRRYYRDKAKRNAATMARNRMPQRRQRMKELARKYYQLNQYKMLARAKVRDAIKRGKLLRPIACSQCDSSSKLYAHHDDYRKPLTIRWLCVDCHWQWHNPR